MLKSEKISFCIGLFVISLMAGVAYKASDYVNTPEFSQQVQRDEYLFDSFSTFDKPEPSFTDSEDTIPEFLMSQEDDFVIKNSLDVVSKTQLKSESAYFLFLDKLMLSYYFSSVSENEDEILKYLKGNWQYDVDYIEPLGFDVAKGYYKKVMDEYKNTLGITNKGNLTNPNSLTSVIDNYLVYSDFVFDKPDNLKVVISGLNSYFELVSTITPTEDMLQNPNPDLCVVAKINPDLRNLPEELECDF